MRRRKDATETFTGTSRFSCEEWGGKGIPQCLLVLVSLLDGGDADSLRAAKLGLIIHAHRGARGDVFVGLDDHRLVLLIQETPHDGSNATDADLAASIIHMA